MSQAEPRSVRILRDIIEGDDATMVRALQEGRDLLAALRVGELRHMPPTPMETITQRVAQHYGYTVAKLIDRERTARVALARQVAMAFCRDLVPDLSFEMIGEYFKRDHGTVMHAVTTVKNRSEIDRVFRTRINLLKDRLVKELNAEGEA